MGYSEVIPVALIGAYIYLNSMSSETEISGGGTSYGMVTTGAGSGMTTTKSTKSTPQNVTYNFEAPVFPASFEKTTPTPTKSGGSSKVDVVKVMHSASASRPISQIISQPKGSKVAISGYTTPTVTGSKVGISGYKTPVATGTPVAISSTPTPLKPSKTNNVISPLSSINNFISGLWGGF